MKVESESFASLQAELNVSDEDIQQWVSDVQQWATGKTIWMVCFFYVINRLHIRQNISNLWC